VFLWCIQSDSGVEETAVRHGSVDLGVQGAEVIRAAGRGYRSLLTTLWIDSMMTSGASMGIM
jgi:hypothetical protein